ncbi:phosphotransferase family protein [uncultured Sphingomonas sp.]|uniref:phosphotransferase family protein n=1 Tax=uncultured Sphingomonas sp. TaxID=158754 RepID=UPI00262E7C25|nr:phosphotransferase family protein [uncultured Sphingomonas sp.]
MAVDDLSRIHGGSSQEVYRFTARWTDANGDGVEKRLILRRAPPSGLIVAERDLEYTVYAALAGTGVPVPAVHHLELDTAWLDRPFFVMDCMAGRPSNPFVSTETFDEHAAQVAREFWRHLGTLAALDPVALGLTDLRNGGEVSGFASLELDHWEAILDAGEYVPEPIVHGAIRRLRAAPPPEPASAALIHGDYRSGNFLFTPDGTITAVLDWEMAHVGDPLEDVAWAIDGMWPMTRHLPLDEGLAEWEAASGRVVDRAALDWWRLFAPVKGCAIWTTAEASFTEGKAREMVVGVSAIRAGHFHRREILDILRDRGIFH